MISAWMIVLAVVSKGAQSLFAFKPLKLRPMDSLRLEDGALLGTRPYHVLLISPLKMTPLPFFSLPPILSMFSTTTSLPH